MSDGVDTVGASGTGVPLMFAVPQLPPEQMLLLPLSGSELSILSDGSRPKVGDCPDWIRYWSLVYIGPLITSPLTQ